MLCSFPSTQSSNALIFLTSVNFSLSFFPQASSSYCAYWAAVLPSLSSWYWSAFKSTRNFTLTSCIAITDRISGVLFFSGVAESIISTFSFAKFLIVLTSPYLAAVNTLSKSFFFSVRSFGSLPFLFFILIKLSLSLSKYTNYLIH